MKPAAKFSMIVTTVTVFITWLTLTKIVPIITPSWAPVAAVLSSVAVYRLLAWALAWLIEHWMWLKSFVFGPYFMQGTWVGHFVGRAGDIRYVVEQFEQTIDGLQIRGQSFTETGETHANWTSEAATIDAERGRLIYAYSCDILTRGVVLQGVGVFQFDRADQFSAPTAIEGHVADLVDGIRIHTLEHKIGPQLVSFTEALSDARRLTKEVYEKRAIDVEKGEQGVTPNA